MLRISNYSFTPNNGNFYKNFPSTCNLSLDQVTNNKKLNYYSKKLSSSDYIYFKGLTPFTAVQKAKLFPQLENHIQLGRKVFDFIKETNMKPVDARDLFYAILANETIRNSFIEEICTKPRDSKNIIKTLIQKLDSKRVFHEWYFAKGGYYESYGEYNKSNFLKARTIEELLYHRPNWCPWALEEKQWLMQNSFTRNYKEETRKAIFYRDLDKVREIPFTIGALPNPFMIRNDFVELVKQIQLLGEVVNKSLTINDNSFLVNCLGGGGKSGKYNFLIEAGQKKYIIKTDRVNIEDLDYIQDTLNRTLTRPLSLYEKRFIKQDKLLRADSIYVNACLDYYLNSHNCSNVPKMHFYDFETNSAIYEFIEGADKNIIQREEDELVIEYNSLVKFNRMLNDVNALGIFCNDTNKYNIINAQGVPMLIDIGHATYVDGLKPNCRKYHMDVPNCCGPNVPTLKSSFIK